MKLSDGSVYHGFSFGATVPIAGEVVFNTGKLLLHLKVSKPEAELDKWWSK